MRRRDERGVGTVLAAVACMVLVVVAGMAVVVVGWISQVSAVQDAADLTALAAASTQAQGGDTCEAANNAAQRNAAELTFCSIAGHDWSFVVEVRVSRTLDPELPGVAQTVERVAFAGTVH